MEDDELFRTMRAATATHNAVELVELFERLTGHQPDEGTLILNFRHVFPSIPLRILRYAGAWHRVSGGGLSDDEFNELLRPWLEVYGRDSQK